VLKGKITQLDHRIMILKEKINSGEEFDSFLELLGNAERERKSSTEQLAQIRSIEPMERGFTIIHSIFERLDPGPGRKWTPPDRDTDRQLRAVLRRMIQKIELTIGQETRWQKKTLRATVTFRNGATAEFEHRP
jgi:hypothetical protein